MERKFSQVKPSGAAASHAGAMGSYVVEFVLQSQRSLDDIWGALVKPEKLALWLKPVAGKLSKGGDFAVGNAAKGKILTCEPKRRLALELAMGAAKQTIDVSFGETGKGKSKARKITVKITANIADLPEKTWPKYGPALVAMGWELVGQAFVGYLEAAPTRGFAAFAMGAGGRSYASAAFDAWRAAAKADAGFMTGPAPSVLDVYTGLHG